LLSPPRTLASFAIACAAVWRLFTFAAPVSLDGMEHQLLRREHRRNEVSAKQVREINAR
jgi:hypothetical protein